MSHHLDDAAEWMEVNVAVSQMIAEFIKHLDEEG
jgi:hypothetical protein